MIDTLSSVMKSTLSMIIAYNSLNMFICAHVSINHVNLYTLLNIGIINEQKGIKLVFVKNI